MKRVIPLALLAIVGCGSGEPTLPEGQSLEYPKGKDYTSKRQMGGAPPANAAATGPNVRGMKDPNDRKKAMNEFIRQQRAKAGG
ncbi:MAG: hypothetical protein ACO1SV_16450 [Fimbriimonas sp.]